MSKINFPKSLISKNSIIYFLSENENFTIKELDDSWLISTQNDISEAEKLVIQQRIIKIENTLYIENQVSSIREILYKKAFSPIRHD
ncbi:MAG: hypothetical protein PQJ45_03270 [Sphaerochaetaceae bacterium]|nr:hypothetical protein [Sphaerochaetaceae bacterium]